MTGEDFSTIPEGKYSANRKIVFFIMGGTLALPGA
jgi:hypothetical protein